MQMVKATVASEMGHLAPRTEPESVLNWEHSERSCSLRPSCHIVQFTPITLFRTLLRLE